MLVLLALLMFFNVCGCATRIVDFTVISTKNIDWSKADKFKKAQKRCDGEDLIHWIIFIPTGVPNVKSAIDKAIESVPGAVALVDGVVTSKFWWIPYIYGQQSYIVEGTPLISPELVVKRGSLYDYDSQYIATYIDNTGNVKETVGMTKNDYNEIKNRIAEVSNDY